MYYIPSDVPPSTSHTPIIGILGEISFRRTVFIHVQPKRIRLNVPRFAVLWFFLRFHSPISRSYNPHTLCNVLRDFGRCSPLFVNFSRLLQFWQNLFWPFNINHYFPAYIYVGRFNAATKKYIYPAIIRFV